MELRLKQLRAELGITRAQMSFDTGISKRTLETYDHGTSPSIKNIGRIAEVYEVNPAWLVGWSDERSLFVPKIITQEVYIESGKGRLPPYWGNDESGQLIHWK